MRLTTQKTLDSLMETIKEIAGYNCPVEDLGWGLIFDILAVGA